MATKRKHVMTPARQAALRKAQLASAAKRRGTGKTGGAGTPASGLLGAIT
jgi:hypothetical protein